MNKYSVLIDCPDEYLDILTIFFKFLELNWLKRINTIYITTNTQTIEAPENVIFIKCGSGNNSIERSRIAISQIKERYIVILDCDCFISKQVDENEINALIEYMTKKNIKYIKLWKSKNREQKKYKTGCNNLYYCNKKARYSKSLMANIWEKDEYLNKVVDLKMDGWQIEAKWLRESKESLDGFYGDYLFYSNDPLHILHSISKGMWIRKSFRKCVRTGMIDKKTNSRKLVPLRQTFKNNISLFLYNHLSSKMVYRLKKIVGPEKFVSKD